MSPLPEIRATRSDEEREAAIALRFEVFVVEQGVPPELERDGEDATATHVIAIDPDGAIVATYRITADGETVKVGRLVVAARARRRGIAAALLADAEARARSGGARRLVLSAQTYATQLYAGAGYVASGDVYLDAGIEHIWMERTLA